MKAGIPQGAVTSPLLFNFYLSKLPRPPEGINILHQETKVLPVKDHCEMIGNQYEAAFNRPDYPGQKNLVPYTGQRMNESVMMNSHEIKDRFTDPNSINEKSYKFVLKSIHPESVSSKNNLLTEFLA